jgi:hypothetical protein
MAQATALPPLRLLPADQPVMPRETRQGDLQHDLARAARARMTLSLAAMTSSRSPAAFEGAARRDRSEGASADQFEVTLGLRWANQ